MLNDGWLDRQYRQAQKDIQGWPAWMKREATIVAAANANDRAGSEQPPSKPPDSDDQEAKG